MFHNIIMKIKNYDVKDEEKNDFVQLHNLCPTDVLEC